MLYHKTTGRKRGSQRQDVASGLSLLRNADGDITRVVALDLCCQCGEPTRSGAHPLDWMPVCERCQRHGWCG